VQRRPGQKAARVLVGPQQSIQPLAQCGVAGARLRQEGVTLAGRLLQGEVEEGFFLHGRAPGYAARTSTPTRAKGPRKAPSISQKSCGRPGQRPRIST